MYCIGPRFFSARAISVVLFFAVIPPSLSAQEVREGEMEPTPADVTLPAVEAEATGPAYSGPIHSAAPVARAVRTAEPIAVDGQLDEDAWKTAPAITNFTQMDPVEGSPISERTEIRFLYDDEAIYVGAWLWDDGEILNRLARRDAGVPDADFFVVIFDTFHDHNTAYRFATAPSAMKRDEIMSGGGGGGGGGGGFGDTSWDPVYDLNTTVTDQGWFVEYRIPFSQLRFSPVEDLVWGLQVERKIRRKSEDTVWAFSPKNEPGGTPRFGHLEGLSGIEPGRRLEVLPYVGARAEFVGVEQSSDVTFADPFRTDAEYFSSFGADLKYRLTSNITLDATVNPDFGQVEVDPAVINLTAFETRFNEKRPFFVEGAEIFRFGGGGGGGGGPGGQILYSRRIGRAPQGDVPDEAEYELAPTATTILGAAKVTGKTANGWSLGFLEAVTNRERADWIDAEGVTREELVEPVTNYFVGRLRREMRLGQTTIGGLFTAVNRDLSGSSLESELHAAAYTGGIDLRHLWADREWEFSARFSPSYVTGSEEAIVETQESSARYYQRPDASYVDLDPTATSLFGYNARASIAKQAGDWTGHFSATAMSPGYELNDIGFLTETDRLQLDLNFGYEENQPGRYFRRWNIRGGPDVVWNYGGDVVGGQINAFGNGQFANYWGFGGRFGYNPPRYNDRLTRGGPTTRELAGYNGNFNIRSDGRRRVVGRFGVDFEWDEGGAWRRSADFSLTMRPNPIVELDIGPNLNRRHVTAQYVTTHTDALADHTYGERYIFANLDQTTLGIDTRVNVTFTPELSFELYAQPFMSSGDYESLKELRAPRTFDLIEYGVDAGSIEPVDEEDFVIDPDGPGGAPEFTVSNSDFNLRSLRGNAVLRWEWTPGSTLFLVWQQNRSNRITAHDPDSPLARVGNFDFGRDARELVDLPADNIFLLKFTYWLNP
ncbi:MAG: hypothetical protein GEU90_02945 [Gemmatimonas sp.]|nr:hypothetical protein [Gemmatimonas sp.]